MKNVPDMASWTDVYALSAVLYRTLTGVTVTRADLRMQGDALPAPAQLNQTVPAEVSDAIMQGLAIGCTQRIRSVGQLRTRFTMRRL